MKHNRMILLELFDTAVPYKVTKNSKTEFIAKANVSTGEFVFTAQLVDNIWDLRFTVGDSFERTGKGAALEVFSTAIKICTEFVEKKNPSKIGFSSAGDSRTSLYKMMVKKLFKSWHSTELPGFKDDETLFILSKNKDEPLDVVISTPGKGKGNAIYAKIPLYGHTINLIGDTNGENFNISPMNRVTIEPSDLVSVTLKDAISRMSNVAKKKYKIKNVIIRKDLQKYMK